MNVHPGPGCWGCLICIRRNSRCCWTWPYKGRGSFICLLGYMTSSVAKCRGTGQCAPGHAGPEQVERAIVFRPILGQDFQGLDTLWPTLAPGLPSTPTSLRLPDPKPVTGVRLGPGYSSEGFSLESSPLGLPVLWLFIALPVDIFTWLFWGPVTLFFGKSSAAWKEEVLRYSLQLSSCSQLLLPYG